MAIQANQDFVFATNVVLFTVKGFFLGTNDFFYIVPDKRDVAENTFQSLMINELTEKPKVEEFTFDGHSPRNVLETLLIDSNTTLESLDEFFHHFNSEWDAVKRISLKELDYFIIRSNLFHISIDIKYLNDDIEDMIITKIKGSEKKKVKNFYKNHTKLHS